MDQSLHQHEKVEKINIEPLQSLPEHSMITVYCLETDNVVSNSIHYKIVKTGIPTKALKRLVFC